MYQLVLQFQVASTAEYDAVMALEGLLIAGLRDDEVDGHDVGGGKMNIFIWTQTPREAFGQAHTLVADHPAADALVAGFREEGADDYTPLWPEGLTRFEVL